MSVNITPFGTLPGGGEAQCVRLSGGGLEAEVLSYGGALRSLRVPSRRGLLDVALGFDLEAYGSRQALRGHSGPLRQPDRRRASRSAGGSTCCRKTTGRTTSTAARRPLTSASGR